MIFYYFITYLKVTCVMTMKRLWVRVLYPCPQLFEPNLIWKDKSKDYPSRFKWKYLENRIFKNLIATEFNGQFMARTFKANHLIFQQTLNFFQFDELLWLSFFLDSNLKTGLDFYSMEIFHFPTIAHIKVVDSILLIVNDKQITMQIRLYQVCVKRIFCFKWVLDSSRSTIYTWPLES